MVRESRALITFWEAYGQARREVIHWLRARGWTGDDDLATAADHGIEALGARIAEGKPVERMFRYACSAAMNWLRNEWRRKPAQFAKDFDVPDEKRERGMEDFVSREFVDALLSTLPADVRAVVRCKYEERLENKEVAERLAVHVRTVERHVATARDRIARILHVRGGRHPYARGESTPSVAVEQAENPAKPIAARPVVIARDRTGGVDFPYYTFDGTMQLGFRAS
jgi:RNA polymerase sigma factor (sigma-70 family)